MTANPIITQLQESDWERLRTIRLASLVESPDWLSGKGFEFESTASKEFWHEQIANGMWFIAVSNGRDIAVMNAGDPNPNFPTSRWLQAFWIEPEFRGRGILPALINFLEGLGSVMGWESLGLGVWLDNTRARTAYENVGFTALSRPLRSRDNPGKFYCVMSKDIRISPHP